jgi:hypothetical protein
MELTGACRAAIYALWKWMGVSKVYMVNKLEPEVKVIVDSIKASSFNGSWFAFLLSNKLRSWKL